MDNKNTTRNIMLSLAAYIQSGVIASHKYNEKGESESIEELVTRFTPENREENILEWVELSEKACKILNRQLRQPKLPHELGHILMVEYNVDKIGEVLLEGIKDDPKRASRYSFLEFIQKIAEEYDVNICPRGEFAVDSVKITNKSIPDLYKFHIYVGKDAPLVQLTNYERACCDAVGFALYDAKDGVSYEFEGISMNLSDMARTFGENLYNKAYDFHAEYLVIASKKQ